MALQQIKLETTKTYATEANALKAVDKVFGGTTEDLRFIMLTTPEGRFYPVFLGERAIQAGAHFHFHVIG